MKMKLILCSLIALLSFGISTSAASDPNFYIYLCFGQSNMESGGKMDEMDRTVDKRFQVLADFDSTNRGWKKGRWYEAVPPLAAKGRGICMVDYFGRTMASGLPENIRVGVVKVAVPGCKIELFEKDSCTNDTATVQSPGSQRLEGTSRRRSPLGRPPHATKRQYDGDSRFSVPPATW